MMISQVPNAQTPKLLPLVQDKQTTCAVLTSVHGATAGNLQIRPMPTGVSPSGIDGEEMLTVLRSLALPVLAAAWPDAKPYINGCLAVWGTVDAWKKLRDPEADATGKTIAVTQASAALVNVLLAFQTQSSGAQIAGTLATSAAGVAEKLKTNRDKAAKAASVAAPPAASPTSPDSLTAGFIIGTDRGMFALRVDEVTELARVASTPAALPRTSAQTKHGGK